MWPFRVNAAIVAALDRRLGALGPDDELLDVIDIAEFQRQKVPDDEVRNFFANLALDD